MPRGDRTGPIGMGPMSGRAAGYCAGFGMPGYMNPMPGRGFGIGRGRGWWAHGFGAGRGWRHWYYATGLPGWMRYGRHRPMLGYPAFFAQPDPEMEKQWLRRDAEALKSELDSIQERLSAIEREQASRKEKGE